MLGHEEQGLRVARYEPFIEKMVGFGRLRYWDEVEPLYFGKKRHYP
jgi:hypothetical protein